MQNKRVLISFYGDDFTGTTATAEILTGSGLPTIIFTEPPAVSYLEEHFPGVQAVGVSGVARTLPADQMQEALEPIFRTLKSYQSPIYLYKVCSTFDSSETVGSIGKAIELGVRLFAPDFIPVLPAAPRFKRYTVFGNHFAALGDGNIFRLDHHPSISNHPATPMKDADLCRHLARQTSLNIGLINILDIETGPERINAQINDLVAADAKIIFFDCLAEKHLNTICETVFARFYGKNPGFFVGSQELGYGLVKALAGQNLMFNPISGETYSLDGSDRGPIIVLSGSCAIVNGDQIKQAKAHGFADAAVRAENLLDSQKKEAEKEKIVDAACKELAAGRSVIVHTAVGPQDERIHAMKARALQLALSEAEANTILGTGLGEIAQQILHRRLVKRLVVAGGDTTGRIQKFLRIEALQVARSIGMGAPLCYVYSRDQQVNGLEVAFKGGQTGGPDYFHQVQSAQTAEFESVALGRM